MWWALVFCFVCFFIVNIRMSSTSMSDNQVTSLQGLSAGSNKFAIDLYQTLGKGEGNRFVSPLSVELVLALALTGAKGKTADEITKVIHAPDNLEKLLLGYSALIENLQSPVLKIATQMFVEKTISLKPKFNENAAKYFKSGATSVDFKKDHESARQAINHWVEEKTSNKIKELLKQGILNDLTRLVLVNAIYFKANWKLKFNPDMTKKQKFHVSPSKSVDVDMMNIKKKFSFRYNEKLKSKILQMEYAENNFSMVFILPDKLDGLKELESKLSSVDISQELHTYEKPVVTVQIPKFKMETTVDLNSILHELGAVSMFNEKEANFSELSDTPLVVNKVIQKAFVEVNEEGTEAAAATAMTFMTTFAFGAPPPKEETFIADHPFIFLILKHHEEQSPLFIGRYCTPQ